LTGISATKEEKHILHFCIEKVPINLIQQQQHPFLHKTGLSAGAAANIALLKLMDMASD
jgi:hypothetical protein